MSIQELSHADFSAFTQEHPLCVVYFSGPGCAVCKQLKPKLFELLDEAFPQLGTAQVDCSEEQSLAVDQGVFTIPTLLVFIEGRETQRYARSFSPAQVAAELRRPYQLCFEAP